MITSDADRFHSDVSGEELHLRQARYHRTQEIYENKRTEAAEREERRWQKIEGIQVAEKRYWDEQRELGSKVKHQMSSFLSYSALVQLTFLV